jgi:hypothetical protein
MADPNIIDNAWCRFKDGELSLGGLGEALIDNGFSAKHVREILSEETKYPLPPGYFGPEI